MAELGYVGSYANEPTMSPTPTSIPFTLLLTSPLPTLALRGPSVLSFSELPLNRGPFQVCVQKNRGKYWQEVWVHTEENLKGGLYVGTIHFLYGMNSSYTQSPLQVFLCANLNLPHSWLIHIRTYISLSQYARLRDS